MTNEVMTEELNENLAEALSPSADDLSKELTKDGLTVDNLHNALEFIKPNVTHLVEKEILAAYGDHSLSQTQIVHSHTVELSYGNTVNDNPTLLLQKLEDKGYISFIDGKYDTSVLNQYIQTLALTADANQFLKDGFTLEHAQRALEFLEPNMSVPSSTSSHIWQSHPVEVSVGTTINDNPTLLVQALLDKDYISIKNEPFLSTYDTTKLEGIVVALMPKDTQIQELQLPPLPNIQEEIISMVQTAQSTQLVSVADVLKEHWAQHEQLVDTAAKEVLAELEKMGTELNNLYNQIQDKYKEADEQGIYINSFYNLGESEKGENNIFNLKLDDIRAFFEDKLTSNIDKTEAAKTTFISETNTEGLNAFKIMLEFTKQETRSDVMELLGEVQREAESQLSGKSDHFNTTKVSALP